MAWLISSCINRCGFSNGVCLFSITDLRQSNIPRQAFRTSDRLGLRLSILVSRFDEYRTSGIEHRGVFRYCPDKGRLTRQALEKIADQYVLIPHRTSFPTPLLSRPERCAAPRSGGICPPIIGPTCAFESKISILKVALSQISCYHKTIKKIFEYSVFCF